MRTFTNLSGRRFGRLVALERDGGAIGRVRWICRCDCGAVKSVANNKLLTENTKSCGCLSRELSSQRQRTRNTGSFGKNHPMYGIRGRKNPNYGRRKQNAKTREALSARMRLDYAEWRSSVFTRDGFACVICRKGGSLNAHHIESFAKNPGLRFDVENGATLCVSCHKNFHERFGRHRFGRSEFLSVLHDGTV